MCTILTEDYINLSATLAPGSAGMDARSSEASPWMPPTQCGGGSDDNNTLNKLFHILSSISVCGWKCIYQIIGTVLIRN